jgi:hypothetical protein
MIRCNNQVGKVEEVQINRNAILRSSTTWPNERVSCGSAKTGRVLTTLDDDMLFVYLGIT